MATIRPGLLAVAVCCYAGCLPAAERISVEGPRSYQGFLLDKYEVSVRDYRTCVRLGVCTRPSSGRGREWKKICTYYRRTPRKGENPVDCVSAQQAQVYCEWRGGRLPTLDEWRWEATGNGRGWTYPWGKKPESNCDRATVASRDGRVCVEGGVTPAKSNPDGKSVNGAYNLYGNRKRPMYCVS
jgi:formylglycine-generating enzyme required for sulfatase activity